MRVSLNTAAGAGRPVREAAREFWWDAAMAATADADLVMMDPDNGLTDDALMYQADGPKFLYLRDLVSVWEAEKSVVTYQQHIHRIGLPIRYGLVPKPSATRFPAPTRSPLLFHRGTARAFFVMAQPHHPGIRERAARFAGSLWAEHHHFEWCHD